MKKILCMVVAVLTMLFCAACGSSSSGEANADKQQTAAEEKAVTADAPAQQHANGKSKTLVVYFSCTGNTKTLAENAAKALQADLFEIQPEVPYTHDDLNYNDKSTRATVEQNDVNVRPKIMNKVEHMEAYDTVVLAYPIWWGQEPRILDTFMESYDFSGKKMSAICTSASSDIGSSDAALAALGSKSVQWKDGHRFSAGTSVDELGKWFQQIGLL